MGNAREFKGMLINRIKLWYRSSFNKTLHFNAQAGKLFDHGKRSNFDDTTVFYNYDTLWKTYMNEFLLLNSDIDESRNEPTAFAVSPLKETGQLKLSFLGNDIKKDIFSFIEKYQKYFLKIIDNGGAKFNFDDEHSSAIYYSSDNYDDSEILLTIPDPWKNYADKVFKDICEKHIVYIALDNIWDGDTWDSKINSIIDVLKEMNEFYSSKVIEEKKKCLDMLLEELKKYIYGGKEQ